MLWVGFDGSAVYIYTVEMVWLCSAGRGLIMPIGGTGLTVFGYKDY